MLRLTAVVVLASAALAFAAAAPKAGNYAGTTSESSPVTFKISKHAIKGFSTTLGYNGKCGQGGGPGYTVGVPKIAIKASGKFSKKITLKFTGGNAPGQVSGKAVGKKVTGKVLQFLKGKPNKCYVESFSAKRTG